MLLALATRQAARDPAQALALKVDFTPSFRTATRPSSTAMDLLRPFKSSPTTPSTRPALKLTLRLQRSLISSKLLVVLAAALVASSALAPLSLPQPTSAPSLRNSSLQSLVAQAAVRRPVQAVLVQALFKLLHPALSRRRMWSLSLAVLADPSLALGSSRSRQKSTPTAPCLAAATSSLESSLQAQVLETVLPVEVLAVLRALQDRSPPEALKHLAQAPSLSSRLRSLRL